MSDQNGFTVFIGKKLKYILETGILYIAIGFFLLGLSLRQNKDSILYSVLLNLSASAFSAGLVTLTIDLRSRKQAQKQIDDLVSENKKSTDNFSSTAQKQICDLVSENKKLANEFSLKAQKQIDDLVSENKKLIQNTTEEILLKSLTREQDCIVQEIKNHIIRKDIILQDYKMILDLKWLNGLKNFVVLETEISFKIVNLSSTDQNYPVYFLLETKIDKPEIHELISYEIIYDCDNSQKKTSENITDYFQREMEEQKDNFSQIMSKNISINPGKTEVKYRFKTTRLERDNDPWVLSKIADGMTVLVSADETISLEIEALHPVLLLGDEDKKKYWIEDETEFDSGRKRQYKKWQIKAGILPYQGIRIHWKRRV